MTTLSVQLEAFVITIITGAAIGLLFDLYRVFRGVVRPRKLLTGLGDLVFWLITTVVVGIALLAGNWGELRFYVFWGLAAGVLVYHFFLSNFVVKSLWKLVDLTRKTLLLLYRLCRFLYRLFLMVIVAPLLFCLGLLLKPLRWLTKMVCRPFRWAGIKIRAWLRKLKQKLKRTIAAPFVRLKLFLTKKKKD